jgi:hypothetical protein
VLKVRWATFPDHGIVLSTLPQCRTRVISKDGKTMTTTGTGTDEKGVAFNDTLVFHKGKIS